ncbi:hypothetical protein MBLNU459_g5651t1 [Dothideomycetes sp. NU459]
MQSGEGNPPAGSQKTLRPLELVFSCSVCDESIHDIYKFSEDAQGFSDQRQSNQKVVTRMWLTECGHLTCSKHLADGAAPFHPAGTPPAAPCPVCVCKHGDDSPKHLFGIRGFAQGEYDCEIPSRFFECPPRILDSNDGGMDAIRFQFLRLVSYGTAMTQKVSASREAHAQIFEQLEKQRMENRRLTSQIDTMTERTKLYEKNESLLEKYKRKEPEVTHYLAAFAEMATELHQLRAELVELGYDASRKDYTYKPTPSPKATASINESAATYDPTGTITAKSNSRQQETHVPDASERTLRGIGASICENLASKGASLVMNYTSDSSASKTSELAERLQREYGIKALPVQADMGAENGPAHIVSTALNHFAHPKTRKLTVDIVINNAGVASNRDIERCDAADFAQLYNVNVRGPLFLLKAVLPYLPTDRSGRVVNLSSVSASLGFAGQSVYGGTKAALEAMTRTWARELAERATVNAVNPGPVATDMYEGNSRDFQQKMSHWTLNTPLAAVREGIDRDEFVRDVEFAGGRPAYDTDVAGVVAMLCTPDSGWCTGSVICANGGMRFSP